jgi:phage FluMu protein Com
MIKEIRCPECNKLVLRYELTGYVTFYIVCSRCKYYINLKISNNQQY